MQVWRPGASILTLRRRADLYARLRRFFATRDILEVDVPLIGATSVSDPHIESITVGNVLSGNVDTEHYLQTSPEYFMKRLLASGSGAIYSLGKAFRQGEAGHRHNPEFTMLEWYRPGFDDHRLMDELESLLKELLTFSSVSRRPYRDLFVQYLGFDPHTASLATLQQCARQNIDLDWQDSDRDIWLDLLMTHCIEPQLGQGLVFIYDYPASQAALAKVENDQTGTPVARRFEAYINGMELANGYWELTDAEEQARRFECDLAMRKRLGLSACPLDNKLMAALQSGLPECAGVALGVDRLLMQMGAEKKIGDVLTFPFDRL